MLLINLIFDDGDEIKWTVSDFPIKDVDSYMKSWQGCVAMEIEGFI